MTERRGGSGLPAADGVAVKLVKLLLAPARGATVPRHFNPSSLHRRGGERWRGEGC
jgi:hypothetical protein